MSSNVGLTTPRGSGTSGYVQRNLSALKPRATGAGQPYPSPHDGAPRARKPDQEILAHDRARLIEVAVLELRDKLEDEGKLDDEEIEEACEKKRGELEAQAKRGAKGGKGGVGAGGRLKSYQVHELAEAKERESERLRRALGLKVGDVKDVEGGEHPMARQERRRREKEGGEAVEGEKGKTEEKS
jgi:hypothetical protein